MPKSSRAQIDEDEKKVILEIQKNSKDSIDNIAKHCGFSRQKVWRIIKRLEKDRTIWGYTAIVDEDKRGLKDYIVLIKRTNQPLTEKLADTIVVRQLEDLVPHRDVKIENSFYVHGIYDWIITFSASDIRQAKKFCEIIQKIYQGYIKDLFLLENMFSVKKQGITNPEVTKLKEFI